MAAAWMCRVTVDLDQSHLAVLDGLMREVLADVDVFGAFPCSDHMVSPLDAGGVVFVHRIRDQSVWGLWVLSRR